MPRARRAWGTLSASYQARLSRNGITQQAYESGVSLSKARGHGKTPEHPSDVTRNPQRYKEYLQRAASLKRQVFERKERLFGDRIKWNPERAKQHVYVGGKDIPAPGVDLLRKALAWDDDEFEDHCKEPEDDDERFLWYH